MTKIINRNIIYEDRKYNLRGFSNEHIFKYIINNRFYENNLLQFIKKLNIGGIYIDVGANIGNHSLFFLNHCPSLKVISFEPENECFSLLKYNITNNTGKEYQVNNLGVWDENKKLYFKKFSSYSNTGLSKIVDETDGFDYMIDVVSLDQFVGIHEKIGLIKIDVEGCEINVLNGAISIIKKYQPCIICEANTCQEKNILDDFLRPYNYIRTDLKFNSTPTYIWTAKN